MTEQSSSALSDSGLNKLNPSLIFPVIGEGDLGHSEGAGGEHMEEGIFLPHCDAEGLHKSKRQEEKQSGLAGGLGRHMH